ncbi:MAG: GNAT family N-acetyltransferase [Actinobacteria bacterium]|nr:GNAT family N-acetyltransferase [Actinomycetota bacterium]
MRLLDGPAEGAVAVTVIGLEMNRPGDLVDAVQPTGAEIEIVTEPRADLSESFYRRVGADWAWVDRLDWTPEQWRGWVDRPEHHLLVCRFNGAEAGYAELEQQVDGDVEVAYFGLLPWAIGNGLGGWLLARAIELAWELPRTRRVWVHTCDLDGPAALPNYRARGLRECARTVEWRMPDES